MPKSGRERKAKRKARQLAAARLANLISGEDVWQDTRTDVAMIGRGLKWQNDAVANYPDLTIEQLQRDVAAGRISAKTLSMILTRRQIACENPAVSIGAVRNLLAMEAQNIQRDELEQRE